MAPEIVELGELDAGELQRLFVGRPVTALLGSGISIWEPTNVPSGKAFGGAVFRALFCDESGQLDDPLGAELEDLVGKIPFENVMEKCPEPTTLTTWLKHIYNTTRYNHIHKVLAEALADGRIHSIITTNYDNCLDQALADLFSSGVGFKPDSIVRVIKEEEASSNAPPRRYYFKIHGSADDTAGETLVFLLRHESVLPRWKRDLLRYLISKRTLLVVGYSGLDFEICPEIPLLNPAHVIWNFKATEDITPNARSVMNRVSGLVVIGDMRVLLSRMFAPVSATFGTPSVDVEAELRSKFSDNNRQLWRARLLNTLSYGTSALKLTETLLKSASNTPPQRIALLEEHARAFHYRGAYRRAALTYEFAIRIARDERLPPATVGRLLLDASDNWRCFGGFYKASRRLKEAEGLLAQCPHNPEMVANVALKRLLLLRRRYQIASLLHLNRMRGRVKKQAESLITSAARPFYSAGDWFSLQQLRLWADRFDLPPELTRFPSLYAAPPPIQGYEHLGFPIAQMMVFRDQLYARGRLLSRRLGSEVKEKADLAERLGLNTEAWKLNYLLLKKSPAHRNKETLLKFAKFFLTCEYSPLMRLILLIIRP